MGTHISLRFGFESIDLHWKGPVDEVGWLVVDVLHLDDHPLVVRIGIKAHINFQLCGLISLGQMDTLNFIGSVGSS